jgi:hypothetical protein
MLYRDAFTRPLGTPQKETIRPTLGRNACTLLSTLHASLQSAQAMERTLACPFLRAQRLSISLLISRQGETMLRANTGDSTPCINLQIDAQSDCLGTRS